MQARKWNDALRLISTVLTIVSFMLLALLESALASSHDTDKNWKARWEKILREARAEGKVVLLGPPVQDVRPSLVNAFKKAYPDISLEYQPGNFATLVPKLRAELARGKTTIDVALSGSSSLLEHKDLFAALPERLIVPEAKDPAKWHSSLGQGLKFNDREQKYVLQTSEWISGYVLVNSRMVDPAAITSWKDMLKPQWKGKIASHDPRGAGAGQAVASYLLVKLGKQFIVDLFKGQEVVLTRDYAQVADWVAQGKYSIGVGQTADRIEELRKEGIPLKAFGLPDGPGQLSGGFSVIGVIQGAHNPNAATVFLNWFLSREGQEAFQKPLLYPSLRVDVPREFAPDYTIPKRGGDYIDTYGEDFVAIRRKLGEEVRDLVGR